MMLSHGATTAVVVIAVVLAGMMAGLETGAGFQHLTAQALPEAAWTRMHQAEDDLFRRMVPPVFIFTVLMLAFASVITRGSVRTLFGVAAALTVVEIVATRGSAITGGGRRSAPLVLCWPSSERHSWAERELILVFLIRQAGGRCGR